MPEWRRCEKNNIRYTDEHNNKHILMHAYLIYRITQNDVLFKNINKFIFKHIFTTI